MFLKQSPDPPVLRPLCSASRLVRFPSEKNDIEELARGQLSKTPADTGLGVLLGIGGRRETFGQWELSRWRQRQHPHGRSCESDHEIRRARHSQAFAIPCVADHNGQAEGAAWDD
jgi:hypothetical protein